MGILCDVSLELPRTAITALIGPSGGGKTSLLRLLNRLDDPSSGVVRFEGQPIMSYDVHGLRRRVGFVFQRPTMFPGTVADNLQMAIALGRPEGGRPASPPIEQVLEAVGLASGLADREAESLSGGEQQRVSIARALMTRPEVLLLDEPTSALDPEVAERLLTTIARLSHDGLAVVMVTHRLAEARQISTYTVMLEAGHIIETGVTEEIFTNAINPRTRAYIRSAE